MSGSYYDGTTWYIDNIPQHSGKHVFAGLDGDINTNKSASWTCLFCGCANANTEEGSGCCRQGKAWGCGAQRNLSVVERSR